MVSWNNSKSSWNNNVCVWCVIVNWCVLLLFLSYTQKIYLRVIVFFINYSIIIINLFNHIIIHFISIIVPQISWCHRIIATVLKQILNQLSNIKITCLVYECVIDFWYFWPRWSIILGGQLFICLIICFSLCNIYCSSYNNKYFAIVTETRS